MEEQCAMNPEYLKYQKWYHWQRFPLVPDLRIRKADKYNTWSFMVHWLCFKFWSKDTPYMQIEQSVQEDLTLRIEPPYLHGGVFIPIMSFNFANKLFRRSKLMSDEQ